MNILSEFLWAPFAFEFMRSALEIALILSVLCACLGVLLVPRGLSMLGDGLAHSTFGGIGIGLMSGLALEESIWVSLPFAVLIGFGIVWLGRHTKLAGDAALGVFFAVSLAIGIAALHVVSKRSSGIDIEAVLFGNILGVQPSEIAAIRVFGSLCLVSLVYLLPRIAYAGFYAELASLSGIRVVAKEYLLIAMTAVATVLAVKAVGVMLVSAWLVIPATIGRHLSRTFGAMLFWTILTAILGSTIGLVISFNFDIPSGSSMTLSLGVLFIVALVFKGLVKNRANQFS
ncbi:MAG: metal ABC transporter permease [Proteobacteria bacterium]|nr:metal ABC transporter permease [Pseudomonadota bacterium]